MLNNRLLDEAKKYIPKPCYILNLYDLLFEWANEEILELSGFTLEEFTGLEKTDLLIFENKEEKIKFYELIATMGKGITTLKTKTKSSEVIQLTIEYQVFEFEEEPHLVAKASEIKA